MHVPTAANYSLRLEERLNNGWGPSDLAPESFTSHTRGVSAYRLSAEEDDVKKPTLDLNEGARDWRHGHPSRREPLAPSVPLDPLLEFWLQDLGLGDEVKSKMAAERITCESLSLLSHAQLQELGVSKMGDRVKVICNPSCDKVAATVTRTDYD